MWQVGEPLQEARSSGCCCCPLRAGWLTPRRISLAVVCRHQQKEVGGPALGREEESQTSPRAGQRRASGSASAPEAAQALARGAGAASAAGASGSGGLSCPPQKESCLVTVVRVHACALPFTHVGPVSRAAGTAAGTHAQTAAKDPGTRSPAQDQLRAFGLGKPLPAPALRICTAGFPMNNQNCLSLCSSLAVAGPRPGERGMSLLTGTSAQQRRLVPRQPPHVLAVRRNAHFCIAPAAPLA